MKEKYCNSECTKRKEMNTKRMKREVHAAIYDGQIVSDHSAAEEGIGQILDSIRLQRWEPAGIFHDMDHLMEECKKGYIQLIVCDSIDAISTDFSVVIRMYQRLRQLSPPLDIYFVKRKKCLSEIAGQCLISELKLEERPQQKAAHRISAYYDRIKNMEIDK